jgi:hypothetical protein
MQLASRCIRLSNISSRYAKRAKEVPATAYIIVVSEIKLVE